MAITTNDDLTSLVERLASAVEDQRKKIDALLLRVEALEEASRVAIRDIDSLRGDSSRTNAHLGALQKDHDALKEQARSHDDGLRRLQALWSDAQRDLTALAEAISRPSND